MRRVTRILTLAGCLILLMIGAANLRSMSQVQAPQGLRMHYVGAHAEEWKKKN